MLLRAFLPVLALLALLAPVADAGARPLAPRADLAASPCCGGECSCGDECPCAKPADDHGDGATSTPGSHVERRLEVPLPARVSSDVAMTRSGSATEPRPSPLPASRPAGRELLMRIALLTI